MSDIDKKNGRKKLFVNKDDFCTRMNLSVLKLRQDFNNFSQKLSNFTVDNIDKQKELWGLVVWMKLNINKAQFARRNFLYYGTRKAYGRPMAGVITVNYVMEFEYSNQIIKVGDRVKFNKKVEQDFPGIKQSREYDVIGFNGEGESTKIVVQTLGLAPQQVDWFLAKGQIEIVNPVRPAYKPGF